MSYFDDHAHDLRRDTLVDKWRAVAPMFEGLPPTDVVEVGAGTGLYTLPLLEAGHRVTAVDLSRASLDRLVQDVGHPRSLTTVAGDFLQVDLPPVDVVTFIKVLHHLSDQTAIRQALQKAWTLIRPGGRIVVFEPNGASPMWPVVYRLRGREEWAEERNLLLIRRKHLVGSFPDSADVTSGFRYLIPGTIATRWSALDSLDRSLVHTPFRSIAGNVWVVAKKRQQTSG